MTGHIDTVFGGHEAELDAIIDYVQHTRGIGRRAARRFTVRFLNTDTLAYWRAERVFPGQYKKLRRARQHG